MAASARPRRSIPRCDYRSLADVSLPRCGSSSARSSRGRNNDADPDKLYRLTVLEEDREKDLVKVRYVGYGSKYDEWRAKEDIVHIDEEESGDSSSVEGHSDSEVPRSSSKRMQFCLYDELGSRIKSLLLSTRKGDPICRINMTFDTIYFDGLVRRSKALPKTGRATSQVYMVPTLSTLDDILGHRWYIRGINPAGDFCFVTPGTVRFHLKHTKGKIEYQMQPDGHLRKHLFGEGYQLIFRFVRGDGTCPQWSQILKSCQSSS